MSGQRIVPILDVHRDVFVHGGPLERCKDSTATASPPTTTSAGTKEFILAVHATIKIIQPAAKVIAPVSQPNKAGREGIDTEDAETMVLNRTSAAPPPAMPRPTFVWRQPHMYIADVVSFASLQSKGATTTAVQGLLNGYGYSAMVFSPAKTLTPSTSAYSKQQGVNIVFSPQVSTLFTSRNKILDAERTPIALLRRAQCSIFPLMEVDVTTGTMTTAGGVTSSTSASHKATWSALDMTRPCIRFREYLCHTAYELEEWVFLTHSVLSQYWQARLEQQGAASAGGAAAAPATDSMIKPPSVFQYQVFALDLTTVPAVFFLPTFSRDPFAADKLQQYLKGERQSKPFDVTQAVLSTEHLVLCTRSDAATFEKESPSQQQHILVSKVEKVTVLLNRGVVEVKGAWQRGAPSPTADGAAASTLVRIGFFSPKAAAEFVLELQRVYLSLCGANAAFPSETV